MTYDITHETRRDVVRLIDEAISNSKECLRHCDNVGYTLGSMRHTGAIDSLEVLRATLIATSAGALDGMKKG